MNYAKLINGNIVLAPRKLPVGEYTVYNPTPDMLIAEGYKPVVYTEPPQTEPGYVAVPSWTENVLEIVQVWTVEQVPITEEEALVRYANELTGAEDQTLEEATETLIKQIIEEDK